MRQRVKLYQELGFPALKKGGHDKNLVGYFQGDTGMINQLVHLWKFQDDADRRAHWEAVFANTDFDSVRRGEPGQLQRMNKASRPSGWFDRHWGGSGTGVQWRHDGTYNACPLPLHPAGTGVHPARAGHVLRDPSVSGGGLPAADMAWWSFSRTAKGATGGPDNG
jgi:NIPSNAP